MKYSVLLNDGQKSGQVGVIFFRYQLKRLALKQGKKNDHPLSHGTHISQPGTPCIGVRQWRPHPCRRPQSGHGGVGGGVAIIPHAPHPHNPTPPHQPEEEQHQHQHQHQRPPSLLLLPAAAACVRACACESLRLRRQTRKPPRTPRQIPRYPEKSKSQAPLSLPSPPAAPRRPDTSLLLQASIPRSVPAASGARGGGCCCCCCWGRQKLVAVGVGCPPRRRPALASSSPRCGRGRWWLKRTGEASPLPVTDWLTDRLRRRGAVGPRATPWTPPPAPPSSSTTAPGKPPSLSLFPDLRAESVRRGESEAGDENGWRARAGTRRWGSPGTWSPASSPPPSSPSTTPSPARPGPTPPRGTGWRSTAPASWPISTSSSGRTPWPAPAPATPTTSAIQFTMARFVRARASER